MVSRVADIAAYFCEHYPHKQEISNGRLTKMIYLADWRSSQLFQRQITNVEWFYDYFGPYVHDVMRAVEADNRFEVVAQENIHGNPMKLIKMGKSANILLPLEQKEILDHVINKTSPMAWNQFIKLVYSTYPITRGSKFAKLDLPRFAVAQKEEAIDMEN